MTTTGLVIAVAVRICQTYPSCGCITIACDTGFVAPDDSVAVDVSFAPYNLGAISMRPPRWSSLHRQILLW